MADDVVHRVAVAGTDTCFEVIEGERILNAALRAGVWVPFECGWGSCGTCKMTLVEGDVETLFPEAPSISPRDARRSRILACQSTAKSDLVVKPTWVETDPRAGLATQRCPAVLSERDEIGPAIFRLVFTLDHPVTFHEGQHAVIDLGDGMRRCYSMSNRPGTPQVEFVMKRYTGRRGSEAVSALTPGQPVHLEMPYGDMWIRESDSPVCLVAGGTGIAPILSMLRRLAADRASRPVRVVYGANIIDELVCWQDLAELVTELPDAELVGALSNAHAGWPGVQGLVTHALEPMLAGLAAADFYVAGPPVMTNAVTDLLKGAGVQLDRIRYDSFG
ncbi:2Fe-2S iron-sulfur cluster binding domain-containing protein [Mycolicibacterium sp. CH28]|uniref:2Fe-2S iron-sulfur cluster binding domain-containing protein n=1 Tax=Mycolicibacterium sp. CH28 TaxID=2512237 RepID=UPI0010821FB8|nr:2Fe-2S iron-sulfur cluster binding domain-containing protein [Mycolicibacterium sp. CH28]TGD84058.1 2Fe-2S iron-sulfur cluster binding domain-containing protein [Mycolicibacterium sp. CH28]